MGSLTGIQLLPCLLPNTNPASVPTCMLNRPPRAPLAAARAFLEAACLEGAERPLRLRPRVCGEGGGQAGRPHGWMDWVLASMKAPLPPLLPLPPPAHHKQPWPPHLALLLLLRIVRLLALLLLHRRSGRRRRAPLAGGTLRGALRRLLLRLVAAVHLALQARRAGMER